MSQSVTKLRELLFDSEAKRLDDVARRVEAIQKIAGSEAQLQTSVASVIDGVLRDAEGKKHDKTSRALAPLIVSTVNTTIDNSADRIAQAIQPRLGEMIVGFIESRINDLMAKINRQINDAVKLKSLRSKSKSSGLSPAELALAESSPFEVEEIYLLRRGSGELVAHWHEGDPVASRTSGSNRGALVSGLVAGISAMTEEAFDAKSSSLRTIDVQDARIYVRGSPSYILAAKCRGRSTGPIETVIDAQFLATLDRHKIALAAAAAPGPRRAENTSEAGPIGAILPELSKNLEKDIAAREAAEMAAVVADNDTAPPSLVPLYGLIGLIVLPLTMWVLWSAYTNYQTAQTRNAARAVLAGMPELRGYPVTLAVDDGGRALTVSGLTPTRELREQMVAGLRLGSRAIEVRDQLAVLPAGIDPEPQFAELARANVARSLTRTGQRVKSLSEDLGLIAPTSLSTEQASELERARGDLDRTGAEIAAILARIAKDRPGPDELAAPLRAARTMVAGLETRLDKLQGLAAPGTTGNLRPDDAEAIADDMMLALERLAQSPHVVTRRAETERLAAAVTDLSRKLAALKTEPTPRERLETFTRGNAVFFANGTDFRSERAMAVTLDDLVRLLAATPAALRVVGYTDEKGPSTTNTGLALARADRVVSELLRRGAARDRLIPVGRASAIDISMATGAGSPNRRVEFEIAFEGESAR